MVRCHLYEKCSSFLRIEGLKADLFHLKMSRQCAPDHLDRGMVSPGPPPTFSQKKATVDSPNASSAFQFVVTGENSEV